MNSLDWVALMAATAPTPMDRVHEWIRNRHLYEPGSYGRRFCHSEVRRWIARARKARG
jgi:hypothetical protein